MNLELIRKYEKEFLHMLHGGKLKYFTGKEWLSYSSAEIWTGNNDLKIIINDKYVELRKALAEGKTLEANYNKLVFPEIGTKRWDTATAEDFDRYSINDLRIKPEETIKVCGKEYILTNEEKEYLYNKRPTSLPKLKPYSKISQEVITEECQFKKYGFEKPDFECEILKEYDDHLIGAVYQNEKYFGTSWTKKGTCLQTKGFGYISMNLTPIKKPWYETCKFPCLTKDKNGKIFLIKSLSEYSENVLKNLTPLTNTEIEGYKQ